MVLRAIVAATDHVSHHSLGWDGYWDIDFIGP
jgi:hypothetical protein